MSDRQNDSAKQPEAKKPENQETKDKENKPGEERPPPPAQQDQFTRTGVKEADTPVYGTYDLGKGRRGAISAPRIERLHQSGGSAFQDRSEGESARQHQQHPLPLLLQAYSNSHTYSRNGTKPRHHPELPGILELPLQSSRGTSAARGECAPRGRRVARRRLRGTFGHSPRRRADLGRQILKGDDAGEDDRERRGEGLRGGESSRGRSARKEELTVLGGKMSTTDPIPTVKPIVTIVADQLPSEKRYITIPQQIFEWFFLQESLCKAYVRLPFSNDSDYDEEFETLKLLYDLLVREYTKDVPDFRSIFESSSTIADLHVDPEAALYSHALFTVLFWYNPMIVRPSLRVRLEAFAGSGVPTRERFALMLSWRVRRKYDLYQHKCSVRRVPYLRQPSSFYSNSERPTNLDKAVEEIIMQHVLDQKCKPGFLMEGGAKERFPDFAAWVEQREEKLMGMDALPVELPSCVVMNHLDYIVYQWYKQQPTCDPELDHLHPNKELGGPAPVPSRIAEITNRVYELRRGRTIAASLHDGALLAVPESLRDIGHARKDIG
ncbi:hypothetical protein K491DRAFT_677631 [Lophiostoma macrostomum CBS 122681]|uniref:Uncharacterized protein n=1 Tax=Lophiostoma macrostomum CBS 122681 TaxID=1314788 RepID=A0A6A6TB48_9PLEO|nr:hypothetical protein K491DRAFT_677631 [Lophiostoma macrostomum CBS 122681]